MSRNPTSWVFVLLLGIGVGWMAHDYWTPNVITTIKQSASSAAIPTIITKVIDKPNVFIAPVRIENPTSPTDTKPTQQADYNSAFALIRQSKIAIAKGDYFSALEYVELVLAQVQDDYPQEDLEQFFIEISDEYLQQLGDTDAVAVNEFLLKAANILPDYLQFRYLLGQSLLALGDSEGADYQLSFLANNKRWQTQFQQLKSAIKYVRIFQQGDVEIPLIKAKNAWHITVVVDDIPARFILDTGASITTLSEHLVGDNYVRSNKITLSTANGTTNGFKINIATLSVGDITLNQFPIVALPKAKLPANIDGLLGLDWLSKFHFVIDAKNAILRLTPYREPA